MIPHQTGLKNKKIKNMIIIVNFPRVVMAGGGGRGRVPCSLFDTSVGGRKGEHHRARIIVDHSY